VAFVFPQSDRGLLLNITFYQRTFQAHASKYFEAFVKGLKRHGYKAEWLSDESYKPCDLAVIWGLRFPHIIEGQKDSGQDYLVMERGYFGDRNEYCSLGFNGLNGRAEFHADKSPPDRWQKHRIDIEPWHIGGDHYLLMGQVNGDQSLYSTDIRKWYKDVIAKLKNITSRPILFRPHPLARQHDKGLDVDGVKAGCTIGEAFEGTYCAITYNSNSGVDAVLNGIPLITMDQGSMAWDLALHEITTERITPLRDQWLYDLAYKQWTMDEMASGEAWDHLKKRYE